MQRIQEGKTPIYDTVSGIKILIWAVGQPVSARLTLFWEKGYFSLSSPNNMKTISSIHSIPIGSESSRISRVFATKEEEEEEEAGLITSQGRNISLIWVSFMMSEPPFRSREKLIEHQKYFQSIHKHTYLKGPYDKITSVAIPVALAASSLYLIGRGIFNMSHGIGKKK
ncbi:hypothetical protein CRYUN_Cryun02cG0173000 [Craigia yunnanensis]